MALDRIEAYLASHHNDFEEQLKALIRIPSISAQQIMTPTPAAPRSSSGTIWRRWG